MIEKHDKCSQKSPCDARSLAVCRSLTPAPGCSLSWSHCESRGPSLAKTLQKFLQSKTVQILSSLASGGGEGWNSGGVIAKYLRNVPRLGPAPLYLPPPGPQNWPGRREGGRSMFCPNLQALMARSARPSWQTCVGKKLFSLPTLASGERSASGNCAANK